MYKMINPKRFLSYLSKKQLILFILSNLFSTASFILMLVANSIAVRAVSAVVLVVSTAHQVFILQYLQACLTRDELGWNRESSDSNPEEGSMESDEDDYEDESEDDDYDEEEEDEEEDEEDKKE